MATYRAEYMLNVDFYVDDWDGTENQLTEEIERSVIVRGPAGFTVEVLGTDLFEVSELGEPISYSKEINE